MDYEEIREAGQLQGRTSLDACVLQDLDLTREDVPWAGLVVTRRTVFLGCTLAPAVEQSLRERGAVFFPTFGEQPYQPYRARLYDSAELMEGYDGAHFDLSCDQRIYAAHLGQRTIVDKLAQRIHDHSVGSARDAFLLRARDRYPRGVVGIMGGHRTGRADPGFRDVARLAHTLARSGFLVLTGGGPGAMEAGNLGAFLSPHPVETVDQAVDTLARAALPPGSHVTPEYLAAAQEVIRRFGPAGGPAWGWRPAQAALADAAPVGWSLAIPTWVYGHEPSNLFSSHIAKYFQNSVREEGLVSVADAGLVFAEGSAGTCEEIFTDAVQNYYATRPEDMLPMAFYPRAYWTETLPVVPCLVKLADVGGRSFKRRVRAFDRLEDIVGFLLDPPAI